MTGNVWFISGATSGFGKEIAYEALSRGDAVIASSRKASKMADLESKGAMLIDLDVTGSEEAMQAAFQQAVDRYGKITHFINAAGYLLEGPIEGVSQKEVFDAFNVNVFGNIMMCKNEITLLRRQGTGGVIVNFGSMGSWEGGPAYAIYGSVKWAISGFTESLYEEVKDFGISGVIIEPGYFRTGFLNTGGGNRIMMANQMEAEYENTGVQKVRDLLNSANDNQPGDVVKGAKLIVDVLTRSGVAEGREIPMRLLLGQDVVDHVRAKLSQTEALIQEWEPAITSLDHDDVKEP